MPNPNHSLTQLHNFTSFASHYTWPVRHDLRMSKTSRNGFLFLCPYSYTNVFVWGEKRSPFQLCLKKRDSLLNRGNILARCVHKFCCDTERFFLFYLQQCRDLCILQLSGVPLWNLALLISVGLHSLQRTQRVLGESLFIACFKSLTSQSHVSATQQTLRTIAAENNFKQWATWPQQHQMNPYRGGRHKEKQFCHLNIIKKHDRFPSFSFQRSWG